MPFDPERHHRCRGDACVAPTIVVGCTSTWTAAAIRFIHRWIIQIRRHETHQRIPLHVWGTCLAA